MKNIKEYLSQLPYWDHLSDLEKNMVAQNSVIKHYSKNDLILSCDNTCQGMIYVLNGGIRAYLLSEEGREVTLFRLNAGDPCVLSASCVISKITFDTQMTAEQECDLLIINSSAFHKLSEKNIYVRCFMYELMTERFSSVMWSMQQILFAKFDRRLASFLLSEYDRTGNREIRMTHEQIAQQVSSAREVVARMLKRFSSDGLVEIQRGKIVLCDVEQLRLL